MEPVKSSQTQKLTIGQAVLLLALFTMLVFAVVWASMAWSSAEGVEMSIHGWIALTLGVVFSLVIGCGLMFLMFYSSRSGYDETASPDFRPKKLPPENDH
ncbi:hypothetical protein [Tardiphaga sp.]|uniref:hypothetical protein n=1 Tax=Tardiphaga sp. TaxID=1926292 RepID=UPI0026365F0D|nr:hypothetical protein [Tardiphaga sp.]MDB5617407.1 hypothetical protein [Tardiphaga sp.]